MGFRSGRVSYARFTVTGGPDAPGPELLEALAGGEIRVSNIGAPSEVESGWVAGRHVLDSDFSEDVVSFGGGTLLFGLRIDTNRVPAEMRTAYRALAEEARRRDSPTGAVGRHDRREARAEADERLREELAAGKYRRSTLVPVLWDVRRRLVLAPAASEAKRTALDGLFGETFDASLHPCTSGALAHALVTGRGRTRDYEDLAPSPFTAPPPGAEDEEGRDTDVPAVPWSHAGPEPKDFVGNEFLMWLWALTSRGEAVVDTPRGSVAVVIERVLESHCAWGVGGAQVLRADAPTRWPESARAFSSGKWPRKAGLTIAVAGASYQLTLQADQLVVSSAKLPDPDEPPATPRELTEHRLAAIAELDGALTGLFEAFIDRRLDAAWSSTREHIADAIARRRPRPSVDVEVMPAERNGAPAPPAVTAGAGAGA